MAKLGVVIGRFQVSKLTSAHKELIRNTCLENDIVLVLIGVSTGPLNSRNPLPYSIRHEVVSQHLATMDLNCNCIVMPITDTKYDEDWVRKVDDTINTIKGVNDAVTLYGGRDSCIEVYKTLGGKYKTQIIINDNNLHDSGTKIRNEIANMTPTVDDSYGIIYALGNIPPRIYNTVDIAMINKDKVLMCKKPNEKHWRFPGGFVDINDKDFKEAARRELFEETGLTIEGDLEQLWQGKIEDWRTKNEKDVCTMTTFFMCPYSFGIAIAKDDIEKVGWFDIDDIMLDSVEEEHQILFNVLLKRFSL